MLFILNIYGISNTPDTSYNIDLHELTNFLTQCLNMNIDDIGGWIKVISPDVLKYLGTRNHPALVPEQILKDGKFLGADYRLLIADKNLAGCYIEAQFAGSEFRNRILFPSEKCPYPCK